MTKRSGWVAKVRMSNGEDTTFILLMTAFPTQEQIYAVAGNLADSLPGSVLSVSKAGPIVEVDGAAS
jgi:hypothetical protein